MPFGFGPRSCLAMRLALLEAKIALIELLKRYTFITAPETEVGRLCLDSFPGPFQLFYVAATVNGPRDEVATICDPWYFNTFNMNWLQIPLQFGLTMRPKNGIHLKVIKRSWMKCSTYFLVTISCCVCTCNLLAACTMHVNYVIANFNLTYWPLLII